jgi:hypothetical protein
VPEVTVRQEEGQIRITGDVPGETILMLLTQAAELVRVQVVAKAVAALPPTVTLAGPNGLPAVGIRGGDANFRIDRGTGGG